MNNFGTLYRYECKKLMNRKIVWISFLLCVVVIAVSLCMPLLGGSYINGEFVDTNYNMYQIDKSYSVALSGREINQSLLDETMTAYRKIPQDMSIQYIMTDEYQQYARPYSAIFNFIHGTTSMQPSEVILTWQPNENDLYMQRQSWLIAMMEKKGLSEGEINFWQEQEANINKPLVYEEHSACDKLLLLFQTVGVLELMLLSISLGGVFYEEHTRKTDQIILGCSFGKTKLYWAKIATGISFAAVSTAMIFAVTVLIAICLYGTEGFNAAFQLMYPQSSAPITCGQAILIAYGIMLITAIIISVFVMVLSELLHSNIATLSISIGLLILSMVVSVPRQYRVIAQIWDWLPWSFLAPWNVFNQYTFPLLGHYFAPWQAVPIIYFVISVMIAFGGKPIYQRFQVSGR